MIVYYLQGMQCNEREILTNDCANGNRELQKWRGRRERERERERERPGRIFKHDVAITPDQGRIFHSAPFIRRKRERRGCATSSSARTPSGSPFPFALVRIINGQFAASAADCIVSLFFGPPSPEWRTVFPLSCILSRLSPVSGLSRCLHDHSSHSLDPSLSPQPLITWPLHFKSGSKFVKTARAARGFGHLESLRLQNPSCAVSLLEDISRSVVDCLDRKTEIEMGESVTDECSCYSGKKRWQLIGAVCARHLDLLTLAVSIWSSLRYILPKLYLSVRDKWDKLKLFRELEFPREERGTILLFFKRDMTYN
jgi:hypothetical protein